MSYYIKHYLRIIALLFMSFIFGAADPASPSQWQTLHNNARNAVGQQPLTWDTKLANFAKSYANKRSGDCQLVHSNGPYGENLFWGASKSSSVGQAVGGWVSERRGYDPKTNSCRIGDCGHYTQIVWKKTTKFGCASVVCEGGRGGMLFVCEYSPAGNFYGEKPY